MSLRGRTRHAHTRRVRAAKRLIALCAVALIFAGTSSARAVTYSDHPGLRFKQTESSGTVADLGVMGYRDGQPFYCVTVDAPYTPGDEQRGSWGSATDPTSRIAAQMVHDAAGNTDDVIQASVAYALHRHFDRDQQQLDRLMNGGFAQTNVTTSTVEQMATQLWSAAAAKTPDAVDVRRVGDDKASGTLTISVHDAHGKAVAGVPWRIGENKGTAQIAFDDPTSGVSSTRQIHVKWHALTSGTVDLSFDYQFHDPQHMEGTDGHQSLFMVGKQETWFPVGTQFSVTVAQDLTVTTERQVPDNLHTGDMAPVSDMIHIATRTSDNAQNSVTPSSTTASSNSASSNAATGNTPNQGTSYKDSGDISADQGGQTDSPEQSHGQLTGTVTLHYDGPISVQSGKSGKSTKSTQSVGKNEVSQPFSFDGPGDYESPHFTPDMFGWKEETNLHGWQPGTYWFDIHIPRQKGVKSAIDTPDREKSETFTIGGTRKISPYKMVTRENIKEDINKKNVLPGDVLYYRLELDAEHIDPSEKIGMFGMTDHFDSTCVSIDEKKIRVINEDGKDITSQFGIIKGTSVVTIQAGAQSRTEKAQVLGKTKLSPDKTGHTDKTDKSGGSDSSGKSGKAGEEDQADESTKSESTDHSGTSSGIGGLAVEKEPDLEAVPGGVDPQLFGQSYLITIPATVLNTTGVHEFINQGLELIDDEVYATNDVSNTVYPPAVQKHIRREMGMKGKDLTGKDIAVGDTFYYELVGSVHPKNCAYPHIDEWMLTDQLDPYDRFTGEWAVYSRDDLKAPDGTVVAKFKDLLSGQDLPSKVGKKVNNQGFFTLTATKNGKITLSATDLYKKYAGTEINDVGWVLYLNVRRVSKSPKVENTFQEKLNQLSTASNTVWTSSKTESKGSTELKSVMKFYALHIEKYDVKSGRIRGDRNTQKDALIGAHDGTEIAVDIKNEGEIDLYHFTFTDKTVKGDGTVRWNAKELAKLKKMRLKPGKTYTVHGTLKGIKTSHRDDVHVTAQPTVKCAVPAKDAKKPVKPGMYTCSAKKLVVSDSWIGIASNNSGAGLARTGSALKPWVVVAGASGVVGCVLACSAIRKRRKVRKSLMCLTSHM